MANCGYIQARLAGRRNPTVLEAQSDVFLLQEIALRRDEAAFDTLLQRHQRAAFNLAFAMTGRWETAEEAVQKAMFKIWQVAGTFQPRAGGTVRSWLLRIVTREGLTTLRKGRRERNREPRVEGMLELGAAAKESREPLEQQEALGSMWAALQKLSGPDRQLVALAYGAEMSHHEIAKELAIPRSTISRRLQEVLNGLRTSLEQAGFAAALPLLNPSALGAALLSSCEPAPGLKAQIMSQIAKPGGAALHSVSRRTVVAQTWGTRLALTAALTGVAGIAVGVWIWTWPPSTQPIRMENSQGTPESSPNAEQASLGAPESINRVWTYENGPHPELRVVSGDWRWAAAETSFPAVMRAESKVLLQPEVRVPARPFTLSVQYCSTLQKNSEVGAFWLGSLPVENGEERFRTAPPVEVGKWREMKMLFSGQHCFVYLEGEMFGAVKAATPYPSERIALHFENVSVRRIELREIPEHEYRPEVRDPEGFLKKMRSNSRMDEQR